MPSNEFKRAVRAYMDDHPGVSYAAAHRILSQNTPAAAPDRVRAQVTVTASADAGARSQYQWKITVDDPRAGKPRAEWIYLNQDVQADVDRLADVDGWRRAPGVEWPVDPTPEPVEVELERSDVGKRVDQVQAMYDATGLHYHRAHEPYIVAVAHELERAGIDVEDWWANPDEPRDGAIELVIPWFGYRETHVAWREDLGWYLILTTGRGGSDDHAITRDLNVGFLDEPYEVVNAVLAVHTERTVTKPAWEPPADYNRDPHIPDEWWDISPDLERALTCYATYLSAPEPGSLESLRQRAGQVREAAEKLLGHGTVSVDVHREGDVRVASLTLTNNAPRTRLLGFEWRSDKGWLAVFEAERRPVNTTPLAMETEWQPAVIARAIEDNVQAYG